MKFATILPAVLVLAAASTGAYAQNNKYDPTGDHLYSYGPQTAPAAPTKKQARHQAAQPAAAAFPQVQYDRTGDHMNSYGPVTP